MSCIVLEQIYSLDGVFASTVFFSRSKLGGGRKVSGRIESGL